MDMKGGTYIKLHDATLERIEVLWPEKLCRCFVRAWHEGEPRNLCLEFNEVDDVSMPHREPWGPSNSVLECSDNANDWVIAMQSGDVIRIRAKGLRVVQ